MSDEATDGSAGLVIYCASSELFLHILSPPNSHGLSVWPIQNPFITLKHSHGHSVPVSMETDGFLLNNAIFCVCDTSGQTVLNNMWTMLDWFHIYVGVQLGTVSGKTWSSQTRIASWWLQPVKLTAWPVMGVQPDRTILMTFFECKTTSQCD